MPPLSILAPFLFVLLWSTGLVGAKFGLPYAEPLTFPLWRYVGIAVLMTVFALAGMVAALGGVMLARSHPA